jgi:hypothetical protein
VPITNPTSICDAVMADLLANAGLPGPAPTTRKYSEPTIIPPDQVPLLAVWCEVTHFRLLTGGAGVVAYERVHDFKAVWYVYNGSEADTGGTGDPQTVHDLEVIAELLTTRIGNYASGVPTFPAGQVVGTLANRELGPSEGVIWRVLIDFSVEEAS